MKKIVSVIIPFYNAEKTLEKTLESILMQNMNEVVEVILINDGSTDKSVNIAKKYNEKYDNINLITIKNQGVSHARNIGLNFASSEYIMFLDADDTFDLNLFSWFMKVLKDDCDIFIFDHVIEYSDKIYKKAVYNGESILLENEYCQKKAIGIDNVGNSSTRFNTVWGKVFRKSLLDQNSIRFIEELKIGEDCLFAYSTYQYANKIKYYPFFGYYYYQNVDSAVHKIHYDIVDVDKKWQLELKKLLSEFNRCENYNIYINYSLAKGIINCCYLNIGHKNSVYSFKNKVESLKQLSQSNPYSECNYNLVEKYFKGYNRVLVKLLKYQMYRTVIIIFYIKNQIK